MFFLGHFILTHHLLKLLQKSVHARIINTSSDAHRIVNVYDLKAVTQCQTEYRSHYVAYGASKLALMLFTKELAKKLSCKFGLAFRDIIFSAIFYWNHEIKRVMLLWK